MPKKIKCETCGTARLINRTSRCIGVDFYKKSMTHQWRGRVTDNNGETHHLGYYKTIDEAAKVYDEYIINNKLVNRPLNNPYGGFWFE